MPDCRTGHDAAYRTILPFPARLLTACHCGAQNEALSEFAVGPSCWKAGVTIRWLIFSVAPIPTRLRCVQPFVDDSSVSMLSTRSVESMLAGKCSHLHALFSTSAIIHIRHKSAIASFRRSSCLPYDSVRRKCKVLALLVLRLF